MGKSSPAAPAAPDYTGAAIAQGAASAEAARQQGITNNPNVSTPYGSQQVTWGDNGQPNITQSLTPTGQQTVDQRQAGRACQTGPCGQGPERLQIAAAHQAECGHQRASKTGKDRHQRHRCHQVRAAGQQSLRPPRARPWSPIRRRHSV